MGPVVGGKSISRELARSALGVLLAFSAIAATGRASAAPPTGVTADCNQDHHVDIADAIYVINYLFLGGAHPECSSQCDFHGNGTVDLADAISLLQWLMLGGRAPKPALLSAEICDGKDNNCDGEADEVCPKPVPFKYDVTLEWEAVAEDVFGRAAALAAYRIYVGTVPAQGNLYREVSGCACATLKDLQGGASHYVTVRAVDRNGIESAPSVEVEILKKEP